MSQQELLREQLTNPDEVKEAIMRLVSRKNKSITLCASFLFNMLKSKNVIL